MAHTLNFFPKTLVVEDEPNDAFRLLAAVRASRLDGLVHLVSDGVEAIDYLRGKQLFEKVASATLPGLLLLNLRMPRLNGYGVLAWLRMHPHLRPARVVVFSSSMGPAEIARAETLGADHCVLKPETEAGFVAMLRDLRELMSKAPRLAPRTIHVPPAPAGHDLPTRPFLRTACAFEGPHR